MKPHYFIDDVIKQLQPFGVASVDFELKVGGNGFVGDGDTTLHFTVEIPKKRGLSTNEMESLLKIDTD